MKTQEPAANGNGLPWSRAAEQALLGAMLRDNSVIAEVRALVGPGDFYLHAHQRLYAAVCGLADAGRPPDLVLLGEEARRLGLVEEIGGYGYLAKLWEAAPTAANATHHARVVAEHAARRALIGAATEVLRDAQAAHAPVNRLLDAAQERVQEVAQRARPLPPAAPLSEYQPFPVCSLPPAVSRLVSEGAAALGCDEAYLALPCLAAVAGAVGNSRVLRLSSTFLAPAVVWSVVIGDSGTMKTPAWKVAISPLWAAQGQLTKDYRVELEEYRRACREHKAAARAKDGDDPGPEPEKPRLGRVVCSDVTIERLAELLSENPRGLLVTRDELAGWLGSFSRYKGPGGGSDQPNWLEMYDAGTIQVDRKTGDNRYLYVRPASVSVTGGIQPGVLARAFGPQHYESGMVARMLLAYPPRRLKRWTEQDITEAARNDYHALVGRLLQLRMREGEDGPEPYHLALSPTAKRLWVDWINDEWSHRLLAAQGAAAAALSKLEGYAARLALLHHVCAHVDVCQDDRCEVGAESIEAGIDLARWFAAESERVYTTLNETPDERDQRRLLEWLQLHGGRCTAHELRRSSPSRYRAEGSAEQALDALARAGHGRWEQAPAGPKGGRPTRVFVSSLSKPKTAETAETPPGGQSGGGGVAAETPFPD